MYSFVKVMCRSFILLQELEVIIHNFKKEAIKTKASSVFVFVLSHGHNMEFALSGPSTSNTRPNTVNFYDSVVNCFSETTFPEFIGRPKMLFYVCCSLFEPTEYHSNEGSLEPTEHHLYTDILVTHSCAPGGASVRSHYAGTFFIRTLIEVWMNNAFMTDIETMMKMVKA